MSELRIKNEELRFAAVALLSFFIALAAHAAPFSEMTPDMEYATPEDVASATGAVSSVVSAVAVAATNHADTVAASVAVAATNQANAVGLAVSIAAMDYADRMAAAAASEAKDHADTVAASVAVAATNHADAVSASVAVAATNHADAVSAAVAVAATNYTDAAVASATNGLLRSESDPVWEREKGGYARTEGVDVTFRPMGDDGGWVKIGTFAGTPYVEIDGTRIYQWTIESGDAAVAAAATNYTDEAVARISELDPVFGAWLEQNEDDTGTCSVFSAYYSESANTANTATSAESAEYAYTAGTADSATTATTAGSADYATSAGSAEYAYTAGTADTAERLHLDDGSTDLTGDEFATYAAGKALAEAPGVVSNIITKAYVEGLGIEAGIDGAGVSNIVTKSYVEGLGIEAGVSGQAVTNIVDGKIAELDIDQESLARAVQVGEDLALIDADTNGWHIAVSNVVETDQAHIHGLLIVGDTIYGAPENGDRIDIDGCDFFYNRIIPGDATMTNGYGNIVTDAYLDWRLAHFFEDYNATTRAMWNQVATINNLPETLDDDLRTYNSVTSNLEAATMEVNLVRDEVNQTNAVMRATFDRALAEAASSGEGWSATNATDECLVLTDHGVTTCSAATSSYYIMLPSWTGTPAHCLAWFDNAGAWADSPPSFYTSSSGAVYVDEALPAEFHVHSGKYLFDFRQLDEDTWFLSVHPAGVGFLGGDAR